MTGVQITNTVLAALLPVIGLVLAYIAKQAQTTFNTSVTNTATHDEIVRLVRGAAQMLPDSTAGRLDLVTTWAAKSPLLAKIDPDLLRAYIEAGWQFVKTEFGPIHPPVETAPAGSTADGAISHNPTPPAAPVPAAPTPESVAASPVVTAPAVAPGQALFVQTETGAFVQVGHG